MLELIKKNKTEILLAIYVTIVILYILAVVAKVYANVSPESIFGSANFLDEIEIVGDSYEIEPFFLQSEIPGTGTIITPPGNNPSGSEANAPKESCEIAKELQALRTLIYEALEVIIASLFWLIGLSAFSVGILIVTIIAIIWGRST